MSTRLDPEDMRENISGYHRCCAEQITKAGGFVAKPQLDDALAQLVRAELIFRRGIPPDADYTFKHALVQDAAYSTLLSARRQQLHAHVVAALERQFPEIVTGQPPLLARHFTRVAALTLALPPNT